MVVVWCGQITGGSMIMVSAMVRGVYGSVQLSYITNSEPNRS